MKICITYLFLNETGEKKKVFILKVNQETEKKEASVVNM